MKLEDAGFDWKILGPDVGDVEYVAWQSDQDAFAYSGQKCSAQVTTVFMPYSIFVIHKKNIQVSASVRVVLFFDADGS